MKKFIYVIALFTSVMSAQVGIGTATPSGALEVNSSLPLPSTQKAGFVPPTVALSATNLTTTTTAGVSVINPITNGVPTTGTIVYNTNTSTAGANQVTPGYYFYNGSLWEKMATEKKLISINQSLYTTLNDEQAINLGLDGLLINNFNSANPISKIYPTTSGTGLYYSNTASTLSNLSLNGYLLNPNADNLNVTIYIMKYSLGTTNSSYTNTVTGTVLASQSYTPNDNNQYLVNISVPSVSLSAGDVLTCWLYRSGPNNNARTIAFGGQLQFYN